MMIIWRKVRKKCQSIENFPTFVVPNGKLPQWDNGAIAQLVEQRTENPCVPGSIPGGTTGKGNYRNVIPFPDFILLDTNMIAPRITNKKILPKSRAKSSTCKMM